MEKKFQVNNLIASLRPDFDKEGLLDENIPADPFSLFEAWLHTALAEGDPYANAMTLCTYGTDGVPDARVVLLRNLGYGGLTFYTNYNSKKGRDLAVHPKACLLFFWKEHVRQVKVQGEVKRLPASDSDDYFASRPFGSQVSAWASQQSEVVASRKVLDNKFERAFEKFRNRSVPRPQHWGGYVLLPTAFEFWQGQMGRLHDRVRYCMRGNGDWQMERLMP